MKIVKKSQKKEAMIIKYHSLQWFYYEFIFISLVNFVYSLILNLFILIKFSFLRNIKFFFRDDGLN